MTCMAIDPKYFVLTKHLKKGQRVRWTRPKKPWQNFDEGVGVITLIWLGIEEMVDIDAGGEKITLCPALGDTLTPRPYNQP